MKIDGDHSAFPKPPERSQSERLDSTVRISRSCVPFASGEFAKHRRVARIVARIRHTAGVALIAVCLSGCGETTPHPPPQAAREDISVKAAPPVAMPPSEVVKNPPSSVPPSQQALDDLRSPDAMRRAEAASRLASLPVDENLRGEIAGRLVPLLREGERTRKSATRALKRWGTSAVVPDLLPLVEHDVPETRGAAIEVLGTFADARAAAPIAARLSDPFVRREAAAALRAVGEPAEEAVIAQLENRDAETRLAACEILGTIGTGKSIVPLEMASRDPDPRIATCAQQTLLRIEEN